MLFVYIFYWLTLPLGHQCSAQTHGILYAAYTCISLSYTLLAFQGSNVDTNKSIPFQSSQVYGGFK